MKKTIVAAALGATLVASAAFAQDGQERPRWGDPLERADANHDGVVTKDEVLADVGARFAKLDANHDGKISAEEREAYAGAMRERMAQRGPGGPGGRGMGRVDTDGDGTISLAEMQAQATERFDRVDTNHDGKIDQAERDAARERMMAMMRDRRGPGGEAPPPPPADAPQTPHGGN
ncbi:MAG: ca2+ sensor protein [Sphingomonas sp.]